MVTGRSKREGKVRKEEEEERIKDFRMLVLESSI